MNQNDATSAMEQLLEDGEQKLVEKMDAARESLKDARAELDRIEQSLDAAERGEEFEDIGAIYGVSAQAVFGALGQVTQNHELITYIERKRAMIQVGDVVRHTDSPDDSDNACIVVARGGSPSGYVKVVGPGAEGVGAEVVEGYFVGDLVKAKASPRAMVEAEADGYLNSIEP